MKNKIVSFLTVAAMLMSMVVFASCSNATPKSVGSIYLKVNPHIEIFYSEQGNVTAVKAKNSDAEAIISGYDYLAKPSKQVVKELVARINDAGYFNVTLGAENGKTISLSVSEGSKLPDDDFLEEIYEETDNEVEALKIATKVIMPGFSDDDHDDLDDLLDDFFDDDSDDQDDDDSDDQDDDDNDDQDDDDSDDQDDDDSDDQDDDDNDEQDDDDNDDQDDDDSDDQDDDDNDDQDDDDSDDQDDDDNDDQDDDDNDDQDDDNNDDQDDDDNDDQDDDDNDD